MENKGITKKEIDIQISLGTMITAPKEIAKLISQTSDEDALIWGLTHPSVKVRRAAIKNPALPIGALITACIFETTVLSREVIEKVVKEREKELLTVLGAIKDFPQFTLVNLDQDERYTKYCRSKIRKQM
jgi:hypothetical protein